MEVGILPVASVTGSSETRKGLLPLAEARQRMLDSVEPTGETEMVALEGLDGRVLADHVISPLDSPPADNSAMDGYALRYGDLSADARFTLVGKAMAGAPFEGRVRPGQVVRIMTGAEIPAGADTVVMQENATLSRSASPDGDLVSFTDPSLRPGENVRRRGEDIALGEQVLSSGRRIGPVDIGLLATLGLTQARVMKPLTVALFASGDELRPPGHVLAPGEIYDSNRYFLKAMLVRLGCVVIDLGVIADDIDQLREAYRQADQQADAVVTCGGASVGEADYAQQLLGELGEVNFWKVAIKPGKPFMFGRLSNSVFFGLPGNPVSALVTFHQLVLPVLQKMQGAQESPVLTLTARTTCDIRRNRLRLDLQRGLYQADSKGGFEVTPDRQQSSGALGPMSRCNCFILLAAGTSPLRAGDGVEILPFDRWLQ